MSATLENQQHTTQWIYAAEAAAVREKGSLLVHLEGETIALFAEGERIFAVDNRCPHMGFPLQKGTVGDCILTCHWHQARFDLASGGTFDPWADDVRAFPIELRGEEVWVDLALQEDPRELQCRRLRNGLERNLSLVLAKSAIALLHHAVPAVEPFRIGLEFGTANRQAGWGQGLTIMTCLMNLAPALDPDDRPLALYHGLSAMARDTAGSPPRFVIQPLPTTSADFSTLKRWFRQFIEVRDSEGAERCIVTALRAGADHRRMAEMLFAAATDHRYIQIGHPLDFTNKAFEALDRAGWQYSEPVLTSLVSGYAGASRMEESNSWRHPVDLIALLERTFETLPGALQRGREAAVCWNGRVALVDLLLADDPQATVEGLLSALKAGCTPDQLAATTTYAAALRIARFHTSNEFGDWDRALHTFTFANAVHQGLRRTASPELLRGVFDAAMSLYLDRFLNVPPARLTRWEGDQSAEEMLAQLPTLLDRQQQVNEAGGLAARYLEIGGDPKALTAALGRMLLREDRDFHTIQMVEAAIEQHRVLYGTPEGANVLVAAFRYLAAHAPTSRSQGQTYQIARRLHRGERLFEE